MAKQTVMGKEIPSNAYAGNETGFDANDTGEQAQWALNGIEAIGRVITENAQGETKGHWSEDFIWHLMQGQQALVSFVRQRVYGLDDELWYTHALLGDYGPEAKARAERELAASSDDRRAA